MPMNIEETRKTAISKAIEFKKDQLNNPNSKVISTAKKLIFEDHQSDDLDANKIGKISNIIAAVKYIVEEVMELTPAEYDAIYSTTLNQKASLDHAIRKIANTAPPKIVTEALFDNKAILFRLCWPEYYAEKYPKPTAMQIFDASGDVKGNLVRAGRIKDIAEENEEARQLNNGSFSTAKKERKRVYNHGEEVDKIMYWAMRNILPLFEMKTSDLFLSLAKPRLVKWSSCGFVKVIEARGCYPTPLDFYIWNSPVEYQLEHIDEYMEARKKAKLEPIPALDLMYEAYKNTHKKDIERE